MPKYEVTDNVTGKRYELTGDSPPTEQELEGIFAGQRNLPPEAPATQEQGVPAWGRENPNLYGIYGAARSILDPTLEAVGVVGGGIVGGVPGAGLGYGAAKSVQRNIDVLAEGKKTKGYANEFLQSAKDVATGATMEMGGQVAGKAIGGIVKGGSNLLKMGKKVISSKEVKAGDILKSERSEGEPFTTNVLKANKIQEEVPNLNLTYGQKSDYPAAVRGEAVSARKDNLGAVLFKRYEAGNQEALRSYIKNKFPGQENIDDVLKTIKPQIEKLKNAQKLTQDTVDNMLSDMPNITQEGLQQGGKVLRTAINKAKLSTWKQANDLYSQVDDVSLDSSKVISALKEYEEVALARGDAPATIPSAIIKQIEKGSETKNLWSGDVKQFIQQQLSNFSQLRGLRGQAYKLAANTSDYQLANNARQIGKIIDDSMEAGAKEMGGDVWKNFRTAQDFYNKEYIGKFRLGTVGKVMKPGSDAVSRYAKTDSEVFGEFFKGDTKGLERIGDLKNAIGNDNARELIKDYATYDFKNSVINKATGEVNPNNLAKWYAKHEAILKSVGLEKDFGSIANAQKMADVASLGITQFEKSIAGKMLGVDTQHAVKVAFEGKSGKDAGIIANDLLSMVKGNPAAVKGIQNEFKNFLMQQVENAGKDISGNQMLSSAKVTKVMNQYGNAIKVLWKNEPQKIKALYNFQEATNILARNKQSQFAGSQTTEYGQAMGAATTAPFMGFKGVVLRFIMKLETFIGKQKIDKIVTQGRFDPNFADHLIKMADKFDKTRNFEFLKSSAERIERFVGLESGISGGKGEALGRATGATGMKYLQENKQEVSQ